MGLCHTHAFRSCHTYEYEGMSLCFAHQTDTFPYKQTHSLTFNSSIQYLKLLSSIFLYVSL